MIKFKRIKEDVKKHFPEIEKLFQNDKDVVLAYLFGSYGRDDVGPLSDIDIAVLLNVNVAEGAYFDEILKLQGNISQIVHTNEVDLVILNKSPITLKFAVISGGRVMYCGDEKTRIGFETSTMLNYLDTRKLRDEYFFHLRKRIKEGTYGVGLEKHRAALEQTARLFERP